MENRIKKFFYESEYLSIKHEKYFTVYEKVLSKYRDKDITLVEIGVKDGGSLFFLKKFLRDYQYQNSFFQPTFF